MSGTLSWASLNEPVKGGDCLGCAEALAAHGMPPAQPDPQGDSSVLLDGRRMFLRTTAGLHSNVLVTERAARPSLGVAETLSPASGWLAREKREA